MKNHLKKSICIILSLVLILPLFLFNGVSAEEKEEEKSEVRWQDYEGKRIGVLTGTLMEDAAKKYFPNSEHLYYNSYPDCNAALLAGKIDAYLGDEPNLKMIHFEQPKISYIHDRITTQDYSFAFRKNDPKSTELCNELNEFLAKIRADGTLQEIDDIWMGTDEARKDVDFSGLTGKNGTIKVVTTTTDTLRTEKMWAMTLILLCVSVNMRATVLKSEMWIFLGAYLPYSPANMIFQRI